MALRVLNSDEIDTQLWNSCVHYGVNGNIFGYTWVLDNCGAEWKGIVEDEYISVMPVFTEERTKWFRSKQAIFSPKLIRDVGPFTTSVLSTTRLNWFLEQVADLGVEIDSVGMTGFVTTSGFKPGHKVSQIPQAAILLMKTYEQLNERYESTFRFDMESMADELVPISNVRPEKFAEFYAKHRPGTTSAEKFAIMRICYQILHRGWGFFSGVQNQQGELLAAGFFVMQSNRGILLFGAENLAGKQVSALGFMVDQFIRTNAGRPILLDFNIGLSGLEIESLKWFGAEPFYTIKWEGKDQ